MSPKLGIKQEPSHDTTLAIFCEFSTLHEPVLECYSTFLASLSHVITSSDHPSCYSRPSSSDPVQPSDGPASPLQQIEWRDALRNGFGVPEEGLSPAEKGVMHPPFPPPHTFLCGTRFLGVFGSDSLALTSSGGCSGCSQKNFSTCVLLSNFDSTEKTRTQTNHLPSHASYIDKSTSP